MTTGPLAQRRETIAGAIGSTKQNKPTGFVWNCDSKFVLVGAIVWYAVIANVQPHFRLLLLPTMHV